MAAKSKISLSNIEVLELYRELKSYEKAAKSLGIASTAVRKRVARALQEIGSEDVLGSDVEAKILVRKAEKGLLGTQPVLPGYVIKGTSTQLDGDGNLERE
jgi:hypothetical protein